MAGKDTHRRDCQILFGNPYTEIHQWLDATAAIFPPKIFDTYHRTFRHHIYGLNKIRVMFGDEAVLAGRIHILRDINHITEMKGGLYILVKEYWSRLSKKGIEEMTIQHDQGYGKDHDWKYVIDQDEEFLIAGHWEKVKDIEVIYPELHKRMEELCK